MQIAATALSHLRMQVALTAVSHLRMQVAVTSESPTYASRFNSSVPHVCKSLQQL